VKLRETGFSTKTGFPAPNERIAKRSCEDGGVAIITPSHREKRSSKSFAIYMSGNSEIGVEEDLKTAEMDILSILATVLR
jgi:hypothetical protein